MTRHSYKQLPIPPDFPQYSDGCTVPQFIKWAYKPYRPACWWHDWARRYLAYYDVMTVQDIDAEFYLYLRALGAWPIFGRITWLAVKLSRDFFEGRPPPIKPEWLPYLKPQQV